MGRRDIKVSVIMACHNSSAYLDEAVRSVLSQRLGDLELILIDDCSSDNTREIAKRYQEQDNRVSVLPLTENLGPAAARNLGIRAAAGEWLGILDSDDVALASRFEEQMELAKNHSDICMIGSDSLSIDKTGRVIRKNNYPTSHGELVKRLRSRRAFPPHSSMVYRRCVVEKVGGFNPRYVQAEDCDLWLRLSEVARVSSVNRPLVKIREHDRNMSKAEAGVLQQSFGLAARVCHFLRTRGSSDPSKSSDEMVWQKFITWLHGKMIEEGEIEKRNAWVKARAEYFATQSRLCGAIRCGMCLVQSGYAGTLMWEKCFGSSLPERLARERTGRGMENSFPAARRF